MKQYIIFNQTKQGYLAAPGCGLTTVKEEAYRYSEERAHQIIMAGRPGVLELVELIEVEDEPSVEDKYAEIKSLLEKAKGLIGEVAPDFEGYQIMMGSLEVNTDQAINAINFIIEQEA